MRYIYYIIAILLAVSALIGYLLMPVSAPKQAAALVINGKVVTADEFDRLYFARTRGLSDKGSFINSLITRELLIQESQREGIDKEEPFRQSIRNFYEQSLIKLLMDRKYASLHPVVTDGEVDRYLALWEKKLRLTIFGFRDLKEAEKGDLKDGERRTLFLSDLSGDLRGPVSALKVGGATRPIRNGEGYITVRLDGIESASPAPPPPDKEEVRKMLAEGKKEEMINDWVAGLRKKAAVQIMVKE